MVSAGQAIPITSAILIFAMRMQELAKRRQTLPGPVRERVTLALFLLAGAVMLIGGLMEFLWRQRTLEPVTFAAGWACALSAFVLRRWAIATLGRFWSLHVEIREQHEFVTAGPYRWLRHPAYLSMVLELVAGGLILNSFWSLAVAGLVFVPTLVCRLRLEEAALVEKFGQAYRDYQRTTPALLPYKRGRVT
jgi:protein-S-isoprenylcysteine O-methyltransferase Ste14